MLINFSKIKKTLKKYLSVNLISIIVYYMNTTSSHNIDNHSNLRSLNTVEINSLVDGNINTLIGKILKSSKEILPKKHKNYLFSEE